MRSSVAPLVQVWILISKYIYIHTIDYCDDLIGNLRALERTLSLTTDNDDDEDEEDADGTVPIKRICIVCLLGVRAQYF